MLKVANKNIKGYEWNRRCSNRNIFVNNEPKANKSTSNIFFEEQNLRCFNGQVQRFKNGEAEAKLRF